MPLTLAAAGEVLGAAGQAGAGISEAVGKLADPNRKLRRAARKMVMGQAKTAVHSPQNLGLSEQRIKQEVGKAGENIQSQVGAATRDAMRNLQAQPGYQRGVQSKLLAAAQQAVGRGVADVEGQIRSADAALEKQEAAGIQDRLAQIGYQLAPEQRYREMYGSQDAEGSEVKSSISEGVGSLDTFAAAIKTLQNKYKE